MDGTKALIAAVLTVGSVCGTAAAADFSAFGTDYDRGYVSPDGNLILRGGLGVTTIEAREKVFASPTSDNLTSLLVWQSTAPLATLDAKAYLGDGWVLRGRIDAAIGGSSHMTDYDWFGPDFVTYHQSDWTHRSLHPKTSLDWYVDTEFALAAILPTSNQSSVSAGGGFKYTDARWTSVGGSYVYSDMEPGDPCGFRGCTGAFADVPVIDYRLQLPTAFVSLESTYSDGPWVLSVGGKVGTTLLAGSTDNHFLRALTIKDELSAALSYSAETRVTYALSDQLGIFVEANYDRTVSGHADAHYSDQIGSGGVIPAFDYPGGGGLDFQTMKLKAGLKGTF